jgi:hypothetical protein
VEVDGTFNFRGADETEMAFGRRMLQQLNDLLPIVFQLVSGFVWLQENDGHTKSAPVMRHK